MTDPVLAGEIDQRVEALGYEVVELERAGSPRRPVIRLRIDHADPAAAGGVTHDDCVRVSRALESFLDGREGVGERYVLEVSSPGVERPLVRRRDFERFAGSVVALGGPAPLAGRARRLEGELLGIRGEGDDEVVRLRLRTGEEVEVPRSEISRAHLVFRWGGK